MAAHCSYNTSVTIYLNTHHDTQNEVKYNEGQNTTKFIS